MLHSLIVFHSQNFRWTLSVTHSASHGHTCSQEVREEEEEEGTECEQILLSPVGHVNVRALVGCSANASLFATEKTNV